MGLLCRLHFESVLSFLPRPIALLCACRGFATVSPILEVRCMVSVPDPQHRSGDVSQKALDAFIPMLSFSVGINLLWFALRSWF